MTIYPDIFTGDLELCTVLNPRGLDFVIDWDHRAARVTLTVPQLKALARECLDRVKELERP